MTLDTDLVTVSIVETDERIPDFVIERLFENKAVRYVKTVSF